MKFKNVAHLYKDVIVQVRRKNDPDMPYLKGRVCEITSKSNHSDWVRVLFDDVVTVTTQNYDRSSSSCHHFFFTEDEIRPILRPLSSMTEEELIEVIMLTAPEGMKDKPKAKDYDLSIFHNDGGNMVDSDVAIGADYSCICYEGQIGIRDCGTVHFFDEDGKVELAYNMPKVYFFLLSKHFDLFGLIESGEAIDATTTLS